MANDNFGQLQEFQIGTQDANTDGISMGTFDQDWTVIRVPRSSNYVACWMWGDSSSGGAVSRLDPLLWSETKSADETLQDLQACNSEDLHRPVILKVSCQKQAGGHWHVEEQLPDVPTSITSLRKVIEGEMEQVDPEPCKTDFVQLPLGRRYELRVKVAFASGLHKPSYKFGDITASILAGRGSLLRSVYAVVQLGNCTLETNPAENFDGKDEVSFEDKGLLLFRFAGEQELKVQLKDHRGVQSIIGGDPRIGKATLSLDKDLKDGYLRQAELTLKRKEVVTGKVMLSYQLLQLEETCAAATMSSLALQQ